MIHQKLSKGPSLYPPQLLTEPTFFCCTVVLRERKKDKKTMWTPPLWEVLMFHPSLQNTRDRRPLSAFTCTWCKTIIWGARMWSMLKKPRNQRRTFLVHIATNTIIIKISVTQNLYTITTLLLLQAHCLKHIRIIMEFKWSTADNMKLLYEFSMKILRT